ncbi:MAG: hypothetical protein IPL61_39345 [Myxococcales bacterium]|nr:hypothetical protein [Myxococcales bacterium]
MLATVIGGLFGAGLLLSGMTDPAKVVGFLDVSRSWDPSLAFVMGGAILVYAPLMRLVQRWRKTPWVDTAFHLPSRRDIDAGLVVGAAIFGVGWGLGGLCPGPGVVAAASGSTTGVLFVVAMLVGMLAQHGWVRR